MDIPLRLLHFDPFSVNRFIMVAVWDGYNTAHVQGEKRALNVRLTKPLPYGYHHIWEASAECPTCLLPLAGLSEASHSSRRKPNNWNRNQKRGCDTQIVAFQEQDIIPAIAGDDAQRTTTVRTKYNGR